MSLINIIKAVGRILADKLLTMINAVVMPIVAAFSAVGKSVATGFAAVRKSVITGFAAVIAVIFRMPFMVSPMAYIVDSTESNGIKCENCKGIVTLEMKRCPHCHFALSPPSKSDTGFPSKIVVFLLYVLIFGILVINSPFLSSAPAAAMGVATGSIIKWIAISYIPIFISRISKRARANKSIISRWCLFVSGLLYLLVILFLPVRH